MTEAFGRFAPGPKESPGGGTEHRPDEHGRRQGGIPCASQAEGETEWDSPEGSHP